jgi:competence protein ComEC
MFIKIVSSIGNATFSHVSVFTPSIFTILTYFFFILLLFHLRNSEQRKRLVFLFLMSLNIVIWKSALAYNVGKLQWVQFDVGQGDATVLHLPKNKTILIDGGNKTPFLDNGERVIAPYLRSKGIHRLHAVICSHPHDDHIGGLNYILENFKTDHILSSPVRFESPLYDEMQEIAERKHIPFRTVTAPDSLIFPGIKFYFLSPDSMLKSEFGYKSQGVNNRSLVIRVLFGKTRLLFMGDAQLEAEENILRSGKPLICDAVKIGHHGSLTSSTVGFLRKTRPQHAVISVGENNRFGHPAPIIIRRLQALGATVHRTDQSGAVVFRSDGKTLRQIHWNR